MDDNNTVAVIPPTMETQIYKVAAQAAANAVASFTLSEYMNRKRAAIFAGISPQTLDKYTAMGLKVSIIDNHKLWRRGDIVAFLDSYKQ